MGPFFQGTLSQPDMVDDLGKPLLGRVTTWFDHFCGDVPEAVVGCTTVLPQLKVFSIIQQLAKRFVYHGGTGGNGLLSVTSV